MKKPCVEYSECVSIASVIQHTKRMHCITFSSVACLGLPHFFTAGFFGKKVTGHKTCFDFLYNACMKYSHLKNSEGHYTKYSQAFRYSASEACQILMKLEFCSHIFFFKCDLKLHQNPYSGSRCSIRMDRQTQQSY